MTITRPLATALVAALAAGSAVAQSYPVRPIKVIVSTSAGGITDATARILGAHITAKTGQPVIIENRAGASGTIAMEAVARAAPDGYTLGFANTGNIVINPYLFRHLAFDPLRDLVPVAPVGTTPLFLVMNSKLPAATLAEFIAYTKANPDKISYAGAGAGTTPDLAAVEFARRAGLALVTVPFRGTTPAMASVISGEVQFTFVSLGQHFEFVRNGALRVLAAATAKRVPYLPDVPTFAELGFAGLETSTWYALFAPRGTPPAIIEALNGWARSLHMDPEAERRIEASIIEPLSMNPTEFAALVKADAVKWQRIVRESGAKLD